MKRVLLRLAGGVVVAAAGVFIGVEAARDPVRLWAVTVVVAMGLVMVLWLRRRGNQVWAGRHWPDIVTFAVAARFVAGCAHVFVVYVLLGGDVDFIGLHHWIELASERVIRGEFAGFVEGSMFFEGMNLIAYLLAPFYYLVGPSVHGMIFLSSLIGFVGSFLFLRAFQIAGPPAGDVRFCAAMMFFLPTLVFWGTLFGKDSIMLLASGTVAYGFARFVKGQATIGVVLVSAVALALATGIRSHMGLALALSLGVAWMRRPLTLQGAARVFRPLQGFARVVVVCLIIAGPASLMLTSLGSPHLLFKQMVARHQIMSRENAPFIQGLGSSLPTRITSDSPWEFVAFLPEGFLTALYRPLPFDVHNAMAAVAAVEGTVFLLITVHRRRQLLHSFRDAWSNPFMMFCVTYFLVGTWLLSFHRNLGLLTRQRTMVLPFLIMMLAVSVNRRRARAFVTPTDPGTVAPVGTRS
jgi:hypothetical protein